MPPIFLAAFLNLFLYSEIQGIEYGVNYVTSVSKHYNASSGFVYVSVEMEVPDPGPSIIVYWQVNEGVIGVHEPAFGSSMKKIGKRKLFSLEADSSYVRALYFTTRNGDLASSLRFESFSWGDDYPSRSSFPVQLKRCSSQFSENSSTSSDVHEINVDFTCNPPLSTNIYNYPRVYWHMNFGVYLLNDTDDTVYYQAIEQSSAKSSRGFKSVRPQLVLSRIPRRASRFPTPFDRFAKSSKTSRPWDDSLNTNTLAIENELANITIGATTWAKIKFVKSFLNENVVFLRVILDAPLIIGLSMVFSFVEKVTVSKNLPPGMFLTESRGKTWPQPSVVTCQAFGRNPSEIHIEKDGQKITPSGSVAVQEIKSPLFATSHVTFIKKGVRNREVDGKYTCFAESPRGRKNLADFMVYTGPAFIEDLTKMTEKNVRELHLRLVVEGHGQMRVSCHVPVPDHMVLINKAEKIEYVTTTLKRVEVILTYKYPVEAVSPFDYFCSVHDEYGYHNTRYTHRLNR